MSASTTQRFLSIDFFKALGIIFLVILHQMVWLYTYGDSGGLFFPEAFYIIDAYSVHSGLHVLGLGIPLLAGITFFLTVNKLQSKPLIILSRALSLYVLGTLMNLFAWGPEDMFDWDVLQFLALAMILTYPLLKLPSTIGRALLLITIALISLYFSNQFPLAQYEQHYLYQITIGSSEGKNFWPLFPWLAIFIAGIFLGIVLKRNQPKEYRLMALGGAALLLLSLLTGKFFPHYDVNKIWGAAIFKPSPFFPLGAIGFFFMAIPLLELALTKSSALAAWMTQPVFLYFSRGILWIYMVTIIIGYSLTAGGVHQYLRFSFEQSLLILLVLIVFHLSYSYQIGKFVYYRRQKRA